MIWLLKGKTLKGKNRIDRGGKLWRVKQYHTAYGTLVESVDQGEREQFWVETFDEHVEIVERMADL